ncbi:MAG: HDOD domain-containing protein [Candidatus Eisenbacteria sp.]|nr:HDOD domain-containing protein [Candidatus Eisenbacteria bacterium]
MPGETPKQELEQLVELLGDIPPMPSVATKILEIANSETVNVADVTRLIAMDQGLTSKLLATCNSPYYGLRQKVKTLSRAVGLLGFKAVRNLVLVHSLPWNRSARPLFTEQIIRVHAAATAIVARDLAGQTGTADPEEAMLGGLMHDTGRLALNIIMPEAYEPVLRSIYNREGDSIALETKAIGTDHTVAGGLVLEKWSFPEELIHVARHHHDPPADLNPLTAIVRAADEIALLMNYGAKELTEAPTELPSGMIHLGFKLKDISELEERFSDSMEQGRVVFGLG